MSDLLLRELAFFNQPLIRMSNLNRIQLFPLDVFNESQFEHLRVSLDLDDERGDPGKSGPLHGAQTAFTRDQLILFSEPPNRDRLDQPLLKDRPA